MKQDSDDVPRLDFDVPLALDVRETGNNSILGRQLSDSGPERSKVIKKKRGAGAHNLILRISNVILKYS